MLSHERASTDDGPAALASTLLMVRRLPGWAKAAISLFAFVALWFVYRRYSLTFAINADHADDLLEGQAMWHGNILLRHWVLTTVSWYTTDVFFSGLGVTLRGLDPVLMHEVPSGEFTVSLFLALWLAGRRYGGRRGLLAAAATFVLMALPHPHSAANYLLGAFHAGTMAYIFLAFAAIDGREDESGRLPLWRLAVFVLALTLAAITDTMTLYIAIAPVVVICGWRWMDKSPSRPNDVAIGGGAVAAFILAKAFLAFVTLAGGFRFNPDSYASSISFVTFANLPQNISWTIEGLLDFVGGDFFGYRLGATALVHLVATLPLVIVFRALVLTTRRLRTDRAGVDRLSGVLAVGMIVSLLSYTISTLPIQLMTIRYFVPFFLMGFVLTGRLIGARSDSRPRQPLWLLVGLTITGVVGLGRVALQLRKPLAHVPARPLAEWLVAHNLESGYGDYWCCADTTVFSRGKARVRPIMEHNGRMTPYLWSVDRDWYRAPANFVVAGPVAAGNVNEQTLSKALGPYAQKYVVGGYTIWVYSHDISGSLEPPPPEK